MSLEQVNQVLGRALLDETFRSQLLQNAEQALKGFDLTSQEIESLKKINADQFQALEKAFQAQLSDAGMDASLAGNIPKVEFGYFPKIESNFLKLEGMEYIKLDSNFLKIDGVGNEMPKLGDAWPSKWLPASPAAAGGWSLPTILAAGIGAVVVLGALTAGIFFFRSNAAPTQALGGEAMTQPAAERSDEPETPPKEDSLLSNLDILCLPNTDDHLCTVPADQVVELLGDTAQNPLMLPLTPDQASLLISASGGSPQGVQGYTVMLLAGPDTYRIQFPNSATGEGFVFLSDAQGSLYFSATSYFPEDTFETLIESSSALSSLAGTWESVSREGTMTCAGMSMNTPAEPPIQVEFDQNGQAVFHEINADVITAKVTTTEDGNFLATVTTIVEGNMINGLLEFSLVSPTRIEGTYSATYDAENCSFERAVTMNRDSSAGTTGGDILAPLKPAEFTVENLFDPTSQFISPYAVCIAFPDVCKDGGLTPESLNTLLGSWDTANSGALFHLGGGGGVGKVNITNSCDSSPAGTPCIPLPEQGDIYLPPNPAGANGGSNPTIISVLDVDAVGVINGIFDLWMMMGVPQANAGDGYISLNTELIQVYEIDPNTAQQALWQDVTVSDNALEISTDQNRLFVLYLFGDEAAAQAAPQVYP